MKFYLINFYLPILFFCVASQIGNINSKEPSLKIGSFNIRTFGPTKISNKTIVNTICQVLSKYDIVAIQEIRDTNMDYVITILINQLNEFVNLKGIKYSYAISHRLGFSSYKEIYGFIYR